MPKPFHPTSLLLLSLLGCDPDSQELETTEFRQGEQPPIDEEPGECGESPPPLLTVEWIGDAPQAELAAGSYPGIRITSEVDFPIEVVVHERWDHGGQVRGTATLGSYALEKWGDSLDVDAGKPALDGLAQLEPSGYSGMLMISVDVYDVGAERIATVHSEQRYFHPSPGGVLLYDQHLLASQHSAGSLVDGAVEDLEGVTRVIHAGAGVVGPRVELGDPNAVEDAP